MGEIHEQFWFADLESLGPVRIVEPDQYTAVAPLQKAPLQVPKIVFGPPIQTGAPGFAGHALGTDVLHPIRARW